MRIVPAALCAAFAVAPLAALGGDMGEMQFNTPDGYVYIALHGLVSNSMVHPIVVMPCWTGVGNIREERLFTDDLWIRLDVLHQIPPHGEGPNPFGMSCWIFQNSGDMKMGGNTWPRDRDNWAEYPHANHFDQYTNTLDSTIDSLGGLQYYKNFCYISTGIHSRQKLPRKVGRNERERNRGMSSDATGGAFASFDPDTGLATFAVAAAGIRAADIVGAHLHLGRPGETGPPILDLSAGWVDLNGVGAATFLPVAPLPPPFDLEFLASRTYIDIHTVGWPDGEVRLQLSEPAEEARPTAFAVTKGRPLGGGLPEIQLPDDQYATVGATAPLLGADPNLQVQVEGTSPTQTPQFVELLVQSRCTAFPLENTPMGIDFYSFESRRWERVGTFVPTQRDGGVGAQVSDRPQRYVEPGTGRMLARIGVFDRGSTTATFLSRFDQIRWFVTP